MGSFNSLYREHYGFVWATVRRHGVSAMMVEDAVHDTFVVAYRRLESFDGRRPRAWLYSIGRRVASSYRRTEGRREARHRSAADVSVREQDIERTVGAKTALSRFLDTLSPADRELFVLSEVDGLTGPELATTLGRKLPTLYSRVRVLRQRFERSVGGDAREQRPAATARGWMLLQPWLAAAPAGGTSSLLLAGAIALGVGCVASVGLLATRPSPPSPMASTPIPSVPAGLAVPTRAAAPEPAPEPEPEPAPEPAPEPEPSPTSPPSRRPIPSAPPAESAPDIAADTRLLREANAALRRGEAREAEALLVRHETTFAQPAQPDLRAAIWIATLCELGRKDEARARAEALLEARPGTPLAPRIQATCAGGRARRPRDLADF